MGSVKQGSHVVLPSCGSAATWSASPGQPTTPQSFPGRRERTAVGLRGTYDPEGMHLKALREVVEKIGFKGLRLELPEPFSINHDIIDHQNLCAELQLLE